MAGLWRHKAAGRLVGSWLLVMLLVVTVRADDIDEQRRNLEQIQGRIEQLSKRLDSSRQKEGEVEKELGQLDRELAKLERSAGRLEKRLKSLDDDIRDKEKGAGQLRRQIAAREQDVQRRLRSVYRRGEMRLFKVLFEQGSPSQIAENFYYLTRLVRQDRALLTGYRDDWRALQETLRELEGLRADQQRRLQMLDASKKTLSKGRSTHESALAKLRHNRAELDQEIARLQEKARRLRQLVKSLETPKPPAYSGPSGDFARRKGGLPWPGPGALAVRFGNNFNAELGTRYESQGIELVQDPGTPILAVAGGKVVFAKPFRGFGNLVILDHDDGYYTLYAQASRLFKQVGEKVVAGEKVGVSGFGGGRTLYFEIRQRGTPLDPLQWLKPRP